MKKSILFVHQTQFGYHTGNIQYCKHFKKDFNITFLCWDYKKKRIDEPGITFRYVPRNGNIVIRNIRFIHNILKCIKQEKKHLVFIHYFLGCSIIPVCLGNNQRLHLDIRTGGISIRKVKRIIYNYVLRFESHFYTNISVISKGLRKYLKLKKNAYILPLGANPINVNRKRKNRLHLLYVGTLSNRQLQDTIDGVSLFLKACPEADIFYTIVGEGWKNEEQTLKSRIINLDLQNHIKLNGYIPYKELIRFYEISNIGVSYVPITPYFKYQPVTKTFEYLMAGMPVIATGTYENKKIINDKNGLIIADNPISFADSLELLNDRIEDFNESLIRESVTEYKWESITDRLKEYILSICDKN